MGGVDLVALPHRAEAGRPGEEFVAQAEHAGVVGRVVGLGAEGGDRAGHEGGRVGVEAVDLGGQEGRAQEVGAGAVEGGQGGRGRGGGEDVEGGGLDDRRDVPPHRQQLREPGGQFGARGLGPGEVARQMVEVAGRGGVQAEGAGQGVQDFGGRAPVAALFEACVVVVADVREVGQLLAAQAGHAARAGGRGQARRPGGEGVAAGAEESGEGGGRPSRSPSEASSPAVRLPRSAW